ncbi:Z-ring formation inhibitor MciZ [Bacillus sp. AGMB 02131]|uniref:Z-ring formation inhibitor MciZ n=1 Tax=Peribacillus faecalis TaxID=2772559 RepID=A0A927D173_9BACI|nr:Z-ring formation inhibitor MciZ [Peribacillus faecalis]MBD3109590.1 Z-ring formation inhibitor MciZ [Peribacillus faecalis]
MKIYVGKNKLLFVGKSWEVRQKLKEYNARYKYVQQWINDCEKPFHSQK